MKLTKQAAIFLQVSECSMTMDENNAALQKSVGPHDFALFMLSE